MTTAAKQLLAAHQDNIARLQELAQEAVGATAGLGCDDIKVAASCEYEVRLVVESKAFKLANSLSTQSLHLAVHKQNKKGSASINILESNVLQAALKQAATLADFSIPDMFLTMADCAQAPKTKQLPFLWDDAIAAIDLAELQESMQSALNRMCQDARIAVDSFETSVSLSHNLLANSRGVNQGESQSTISWSYMGMAREDDEVSGMDYDSGFSYQAAGWLDHCLMQIDTFTGRLLHNLQLVTSPSYKGPVIFSPRAVDDILLSIIGYHLAGRTVMDGKSRWQDSLGQAIFPKTISLIDKPHHPQLAGATAFDSDGLPTKEQALIENGVLKNFAHDLYSAKRSQTHSNAMAGGPFALTMLGGPEPLSALQNARKQILYVERFAGNTDPLTGHFSGVAKGSSLLESGEWIGNVNETLIAGNIFDAANSLQPSKEVENISGSALLPHVLLDGVSVTGGG